MDGGVSTTDIVTFGAWRFDRRLCVLSRKDSTGQWTRVAVGSRATDVLAVLLREQGNLVTKDALLDAVWPGTAVEANNLTVQIAALRRVLDDGGAGESCIQTVPSRGYRLTCEVKRLGHPANAAQPTPDIQPPDVAHVPAISRPPASGWRRRRRVLGLVGALAAVLPIAIAIHGRFLVGSLPPPRMSVLVWPFEDLGGSGDDRLAAAITDDLTTGLSFATVARVVNAKASRALDARNVAVAKLGLDAGARYVVMGSEQRLADSLRMNAQIVSTETGSALWADRFDVSMADPASGQEAAVERIRNGVDVQLLSLEAARSRSERPNNPDAFDLYLRARSLSFQPPTPARTAEIRSLLERAWRLEPSSNVYRLTLSDILLSDEDQNPHGRKVAFERTSSLLADAQASHFAPSWVSITQLYWLYWQENRRCPEVVAAAEHFLTEYRAIGAASAVYRWLGACKIVLGQAEEGVAAMQHAVTLEPSSYRSRDYRNLQLAYLLLGKFDESIGAGEQALAANPGDVAYERATLYRRLAAAYALSGRLDIARHKLAYANEIQPYLTLRALSAGADPSPVYAAQIARMKDGLRLAGMRDHADEGADFGSPSDDRLHQEYNGPTPLTVPGAKTMRTDDLVRLLADSKPVVIDGLTSFAGPSVPGATGLRYAGAGGELTDLAQDRLRTKMRALTNGNADIPVVAVGWNSEAFDGRNLALRIAALGYRHVYWYRGGREAWEVRGLPEAELTAQDW